MHTQSGLEDSLDRGEDRHGKFLSDLGESSYIVPGDVRHGSKPLPLSTRLHVLHRFQEVAQCYTDFI